MKPTAPSIPAADPGREALRARVLDHARQRFMACGFNTIRMDDLASELGMSKKTIYRLFSGKKALLEEVMSIRIREVGDRLEQIHGDPTLDFPAKLRAMIVFMAERLSEAKQPFLFDIQRYAPDVFTRVETFRQQLIPSYFGRLLGEGVRRGMVRSDLDSRMVIQLIMTSIHHIVNPENLTRLSVLPGQAFETILSVVFEGVMTPAGRAQYAKRRRENR